METRTVKIGDQDIPITRFRGLKAILAGALVARVMREVPGIEESLTTFRKNYRKENTLEITPAMARLPRFEILGLTPEDFAAAGGVIELPEEPTGEQVFVAMVPDLFDLARKEVMRFLALIAIPNSELEEADDADNVDEALDRKAKQLFRHGDIDELLELVTVGWEVLQDQIMSKKERLGKLMELPFLRTLLSTSDQEMTDLTPPTSLPDAPTSSTDSEPSTDGTAEPLFTEPLGTS